MAANYVRFETPKDLVDKVYEAIAIANKSGKVSKGVNEVTKMIERGTAKLVIMAADVSPEEIMMHIPVLCDEKKAPYVYAPSKEELGKAAGMGVPTSSVAITEEGESKKLVSEIASKVEGLAKTEKSE